MARDAELDRLQAARDAAFQRKQAAYTTQQHAWEQRAKTRERMNKAYEQKQRAHHDQQGAWERFQDIKRRNSNRIDQLNAQQDAAYHKMRDAFAHASQAHERRDGASAKSWSERGHMYKAESQTCVSERRRLVDEIRRAREDMTSYQHEFQSAKHEFDAARAEFNKAKTAHEHAQSEFRKARDVHQQASEAAKARLTKVKAANAARRADNRDIAERAGVARQYLDDIWVTKGRDGVTNIYFGGIGKANGPGHGHYVVNANGRVTYRRDPFDPHGSQNFEGPGKDGHRGGFGKSQHGWIEDRPVTFALGWGTRQGHTLIADGHLTQEEFRDSRHHDHYGPGDGSHNNGTLRRRYTGPGA